MERHPQSGRWENVDRAKKLRSASCRIPHCTSQGLHVVSSEASRYAIITCEICETVKPVEYIELCARVLM
jgi:hypothetical protein